MEPAELVRIRRANRMTQQQLATRLGVHPITVSRWETGQAPIDSSSLERFRSELKMNARINRKLPLDARAYVRFLNVVPIGREAKLIEDALASRFNSDTMVGHVDVQLALEREGWRVVSAEALGGRVSNVDIPLEPEKPTDWRDNVIEALRDGGVRLAH